MASRRPRYRTGRPELDRRIGELLDAAGVTKDRDLLFEIMVSATLLASDDADTLDLKITNAALREMREAFRLFARYRGVSKVTLFGSARVQPDSKEYEQARAIAATMASHGWMVVTGAGPGIMAAGMEGAGTDLSIGVNIRLPFEQGANPIIAHDDKLVSMKYFFTRKLMLIKESRAFLCLPGGFGTLDETFELLTLAQTGKNEPVPIVLLDVPGGTYWERVRQLMEDELVTRGLIDPSDMALFRVTDRVDETVGEILGFYANYDSMRYVGDVLVLRVQRAPDDAQLADLNERFAHLCASGRIERTDPLPDEVADNDKLDLARIRLNFNKRYYGELRALIDALNDLP
ncbi:MAG TPA: TIGR00730 family Rossman fold protein [Acidimicrobiales bacterium]|nr:TIGR00730 family Rossman fold protein [Acidimicrobiales bacterium]